MLGGPRARACSAPVRDTSGMSHSDTVTIAIPTRNRSRLLVRAIESCLAQTYPNLDVVVSVDLCTDDTVERLKEFSDPRLRIFYHDTAQGLAGNSDFAVRRAAGKYLLVLNDDDTLHPNAIELLAAPFLRDESMGLTWSPCRIVDDAGNSLWMTEGGPELETPAEFFAGLWEGTRGPRLCSIMIRTEDALAAGGYQDRYGAMCDLGNYGPAALRRDKVACIDSFLADYTNHSTSATGTALFADWLHWANLIHDEMVEVAESRGDGKAKQTLQAVRKHYLSAIVLTILIQTFGRPGFLKSTIQEAFRSPDLMFSPYVARRVLRDGWKVVRSRLR